MHMCKYIFFLISLIFSNGDYKIFLAGNDLVRSRNWLPLQRFRNIEKSGIKPLLVLVINPKRHTVIGNTVLVPPVKVQFYNFILS